MSHLSHSHTSLRARKSAAILGSILALGLLGAGSASASFGVSGFSSSLTEANGDPYTQAGGHPYADTTSFTVNTITDRVGEVVPDVDVKDITVDLPTGLIGNPNAIPKCSPEALNGFPLLGPVCPLASQIGVEVLDLVLYGRQVIPVYNVAPGPEVPAELGFNVPVPVAPIYLEAHVLSANKYGVSISLDNVSQGMPVISSELTIWGVPGDARHNASRGKCLGEAEPANLEACSVEGAHEPYLTAPENCQESQETTTLLADSWNGEAQQPVTVATPGPTGCGKLVFHPAISVEPDTAEVGAPTGVTIQVNVPQSSGGLATPELKNAVVTLPAGMSVDPSAADGLAACTNAQFGVTAEEPEVEIQESPVSCLAASTVGTVAITTPLLSSPLTGNVYLGQPLNQESGSGKMFRIFVDAEGHGVSIRLVGSVKADPDTGRLTATFENNPQQPFSSLTLHLNGGVRAPLANPSTCGVAQTTSDLTPWSGGPGGTPDATPTSSFEVTGCSGTTQPFAPAFSAGSVNPAAGAAGPFTMTVSRSDPQQRLSSIRTVLPAGLLGRLKDVAQCPEPNADLGTCGEASLVGHTTVASGAGAHPFYLSGKVYLTGPYDGAPFGLSIAVPAVAGPYNLGTVVVRARIEVNPRTTQLTVTSDPLPQVIDGVPLRLQLVNVTVDRAGFMFNPTSCAPTTVGGTITGAQGAVANVSSPFQVGGCASLPFKPKLSARTAAKASKANGASLDVKVTSGQGQANIRSVKVDLPKRLPSRLSTLNKACLAATFEANPARCPAAANVGSATASTPVLARPLTGPAYLVSHGGAAFPDLEIVLQGEGITVILDGKTNIGGGITSSAFNTVPDAPISSFELKLPTGKNSLLTAYLPGRTNPNLCGQTLDMPTRITAQNGEVLQQTTKMAISGCPKTKKHTKATPKRRAKAKKR